MNIIYDSYNNIAKNIGNEIIEIVKNKPNALICLPSGATPMPIFNYLIMHKSNVDFSLVTFVGLDEFIGLGHKDDGSCYYMLSRDFFSKINLSKDQLLFFDGKGSNENIIQFIEQNTLDYVVLGVGQNGHIGLNEPDTIQNGTVIEVNLSTTTKRVMEKYFENEPIVCEKGITMSLDYLKKSKELVIVINDVTKKHIVAEILDKKKLPVTDLLSFEHARLYILEELK